MSSHIQQQLTRQFYFAEAMALYEQYYRPLAEIADDEVKREFLSTSNRTEDRPLSWVPLVFHCTDFEHFPGIVESGFIRNPVHLTEIPIGELDRMKIRGQGKQQIAIGFPRAYVQKAGFAPVLYAKHVPELREVLEKNCTLRASLEPFVDLKGDLGAFQEIRTRNPLSLDQAVWLLTTEREGEKQEILSIPHKDQLESKLGHIPMSYWHRAHQMGVLEEWQFIRFIKDGDGKLMNVELAGEHYWKKQCYDERSHLVKMPAGKNHVLRFHSLNGRHAEFEGPYRFLDVAKILKSTIAKNFPLEELPYSLLADL